MNEVSPPHKYSNVGVVNTLASYDQAKAVWPNAHENFNVLDNIFTTPGWQEIWWSIFGSDSKLMLLSFETSDGIQGIAPLACRDGEISFVGSQDLFDYSDFIICDGYEVPFFYGILNYLVAKEWKSMTLLSLRHDSVTLAHLPPVARELGFSVEIIEEDLAPVLDLPGDWDTYLSALPKKPRHELKRKVRRLENADGAFTTYCISESKPLDKDLEDFFKLMRLAREPKHRFLTSVREQFIRTIAQHMSDIGSLRLFFMEYNGERIAGVMCFDHGSTRFMYNSGFHPDYSYYSAGYILKASCIKDAIASGKNKFDFLRGNERYKYDLGGTDRSLYQIVVRHH